MFLTKSKLLLGLVFVLGLTACASQEQKMIEAGAIRLSAEQTIAHISGNTEKWTKGGGYYHPNGLLDIIWDGTKASGTYTVDSNGNVCTKLDKTYCHFYMNDEGAIIMISEGKNLGARELMVGNHVSEL